MGGSTLSLAPDAFSGRKLGKYEVLCRLSTGGMAEIFLASQRGLAGFRKLVVLKQILPDIKGEEEFVQMFLDEARVTAAFNHPHIAQVFDLDVADGELFLAMEFVPGATLVEVAKACRAANEPIPMGLGLSAARDTALALHYAHTFTDPLGRPSSVIHRDVAEKNIMVTYEGVTKLLDFGIAKNLARKSRTQIGMVKGTSGYMSPEQILGERLDARSDLFSLGVVLHECLTGLRLFHAKTPAEGAGAVLHGQVPPPSRANKAVPPELDAIVLKALARKREDRYASTLEFARALERAAGPLFWHPEQNGELIRRLFADRREETRQLLMAGQALSGESSGEVRLSQIFSLAGTQQAPELPEEPATRPSLPQITPALPPAPRPSLLETASQSAARAPQPPPQEAPQAKPPTPPRGAPTRRPTSSGIPTVSGQEPASLRRPVLEPLPQKRTTTGLSNELMPPPPPVDERTGRTEPGDEPVDARRASWDSNATRAAPLDREDPPDSEADSSKAETRPALDQIPRSEPRARPVRVDMHSMGTIPSAEGPSSLRRTPAAPSEPDERGPEVKTTLNRTRSTGSERIPTPGSRPSRRRTPEPEEERYLQTDFVTSPVRALQMEEEPASDTNETLIPDSEEKTGLVTPAIHPPEQKRSALPIVAAVVLVLLGGIAVVMGLGLDNGRLIGLIDPTPHVENLGGLEPLSAPGTPARPAPSSAGQIAAPATPAPAEPSQPTANSAPPEPASPTEAAAPPGTEVAIPTTPPGTEAAVPTSPPGEAAASPTPPGEEATPVAVAADETKSPESEPDDKAVALAADDPEESTGPPKRTRTTSKRTRQSTKSSVANTGSAEASGDDEPSSASATSGPGTLTLVTEPYAKVYLGRRYLGDTPLFKLNLPAGRHSLKLVGGDGQAFRLPVQIKPGETTGVKISLSDLARQ